ncbi:discoidin domain-containing protein, partial [Verrucomicrobiota bacterium]
MKRIKLYLLLMLTCIAAQCLAEESAPVVSASSILNDSYSARYAVDGDPKTSWIASFQGKNHYLMIDFGGERDINQVEIQWSKELYALEYKLQIAGEDKKWRTLFHQQNGKGGTEKLTELKGHGSYLRVLCLKAFKPGRFSILELNFGHPDVIKKLEHVHKEKVLADLKFMKKKLAEFGVREIVFAARAQSNDRHWYANLGYWSFNENRMIYGKGGFLCKLNVDKNEMTFLINDSEGTIRDPVVHYDAKKILFSWRKSGTRIFHLYECDINGKNIKQLTDGEYDDIEPCYLPDGGIIFVSTRCNRWVNCWLTQVAILYRCDGDGKNIRQLSANVEHDNTPWVLHDGRILYTRWEYVDRSQMVYHHLWTANPDGTGQMVYFGNLRPGGVFIDAKPIPGSEDVVLINSPGHGGRDHCGLLATLTEKLGPDNLSALKNIVYGRRGDYRDPWAFSEDFFIVAEQRSIFAMDAAGRKFSIYSLPSEFMDLMIHEPRPIIRRERERIIPPRVNLSKNTGQLILNDVYFGRNMKGVKRGEIKKLLVLESLPKPVNFTGGMDPLTYGGSFTLERIVGTVPVEDDGSAFMELPANRA